MKSREAISASEAKLAVGVSESTALREALSRAHGERSGMERLVSIHIDIDG